LGHLPSPEQDSGAPESPAVETGEKAKRKFIEPEISSPVDVLEATTFFQGTTIGSL